MEAMAMSGQGLPGAGSKSGAPGAAGSQVSAGQGM
jgi:hypothetical protein